MSLTARLCRQLFQRVLNATAAAVASWRWWQARKTPSADSESAPRNRPDPSLLVGLVLIPFGRAGRLQELPVVGGALQGVAQHRVAGR